MKLNLKKSRYLTKEECGDGITVTIDSFVEENVAPNNAKADIRWVAILRETKPLVLNSTNGERLTTLFGSDDADAWVGKRIELYNDQSVLFQGNRGGIRVRVPNGKPVTSMPVTSQPVTKQPELLPVVTSPQPLADELGDDDIPF